MLGLARLIPSSNVYVFISRIISEAKEMVVVAVYFQRNKSLFRGVISKNPFFVLPNYKLPLLCHTPSLYSLWFCLLCMGEKPLIFKCGSFCRWLIGEWVSWFYFCKYTSELEVLSLALPVLTLGALVVVVVVEVMVMALDITHKAHKEGRVL